MQAPGAGRGRRESLALWLCSSGTRAALACWPQPAHAGGKWLGAHPPTCFRVPGVSKTLCEHK